MNEMRYDWLSDRWVIYAPHRHARPDDFDRTPASEPQSHADCPFCRGFEHETPEPTLILPQPDRESTRSTRQSEKVRYPRNDWLVRVVPNKFPAVTYGPTPIQWSLADMAVSHTAPGSDDHADAGSTGCSSLFIKRQTAGAHEVIIECPQHVDSITQLPLDHAALVFEAYRRRLIHWRARSDMKYASVFKNFGVDAGASLVHSHSQLICTNFVPSDVKRIQQRLEFFQQSNHRCYTCNMLEQELESGSRIVADSGAFVAICPFASRFPFSVSILPRRHCPRFEDCTAEELRDLAGIVQQVLTAIQAEHPRCAYNYVLQTSPFDCNVQDAFHWRLKIIPRLSKVAGFEWSSDCFINTVLPEDAAQALRMRLPGSLRPKLQACSSHSIATRASC